MPMPKVTTSVIDLTNRVSAVGTYNSAIIVAAKKGPINTPTLVTSQTDFLEKFTPNESLEIGWDTALYEAYIYLGQLSNLYVVRAAAENALYGGCEIRTYKSELPNASFAEGLNTEDAINAMFDGEAALEDALIIYGSSQGAFNNDLAISIITDPEKVKLEGAFIVNVYKKGILVETHTCSLDPKLKNGYGVNCFAETVLQASNYIRADVNDEEDTLKEISYTINIIGQVNFENEVVAAMKKAKKDRIDLTCRRIRTYVNGDIVKVAGANDANGYYKCIQAGKTAEEADIPTFIQNDEYVVNVIDGTCIWELQEVVKPYDVSKDFKAGDIAIITSGSNTLYYRAYSDGTTGSVAATFIDENGPLENVDDGTISWINQTQSRIVTEKDLKGYSAIRKAAETAFDLTTSKCYSDIYLAKEIELEKTINIADPTMYLDRITGKVKTKSIEAEIKYSGKYTGEESEEHYCLPKETGKDASGKLILIPLKGGSDGTGVTDVERIKALKTLKNMNDINVQLIMDAGNTTPAYHRAMDEVCSFREDSCKGIISTPYVNEMGMITGDAQKDVVNYRKYDLNANTRNLELYTTHQLVYDEFNDRNIYVSPSCFVAARIMKVAEEYGWHWAAAGYNRGVINSLDVAKAFDPSEVDTFSDAQINTIIKEPGTGQIIFDELTLLNKSCDLQDAHISRYVDIYLRPRIKTALKSFLFEFNDDQTRMLITKMLTTFFEPEVSSRALYDYKVVCDTTNNKPRDIQNNICNVWVFLQVVHLAKWIPCKLILTPTSVSFAEAATQVG